MVSKMGKKKYKLKAKTGKILLLGIILIIIGIGATFFILQQQEIAKINSHFFEYAKTAKETSLYNKKRQKIATIVKDFPIELEEKKVTATNQKYFKLKNTNYYIYYEDIKKGTKSEKLELGNNQMIQNRNVTSSKKVVLTKDEKNQITFLKDLNLPIVSEDETKYSVLFQQKLLELEKGKEIELKQVQNTEEKQAEHISVLYFEDISDVCNDYNCTTTEHFKEEWNALKEIGYYTITKQEFEKYINHYIQLKDKAIFLTTSAPVEKIKPFADELQITIETIESRENVKYFSTNKTTTLESTKDFVDRYQIRNTTPTENIIKMANGEEIKEATDENQSIPVLNYHFFYDAAGGESCNESICLDTAKFREHLQYLKDNQYKTLTMDEFKKWMYGEIELPSKSILITVDDGAMGTGKHNGNKLIPMIEEFNMNATLFLIAGWWGIDNYQSPNLDIQSHTYDMHQYGSCGRGQINCATYEEAKADLEKSIAIIQNTDSFCFPFYMYSNTSIQAIKDTGFKMAFVGGSVNAKRSNNKYLIPRYPIHSNISLNRFIDIVS